MPPVRIVSLLPSATEIVCALGAGAELVGVSHECDFPAAIVGRPVLTSARIDSSQSSSAIDRAVRSVIRDALSIYAIDEAALAGAAPDVIITQDLCEVCAVSIDDVRRAVGRIAGERPVKIVSLRPTRLADVFEEIESVARAIGRESQGRALRASLDQRVADIASRARAASSRPRVVSIEWIEPVMLGGTWMPEIIELAGGDAVGVTAGAPAPTIAPEDLAGLRPDVVVIKPCGFGLERCLSEMETIERTICERVAASCRIYATDGNAFFNRPGPRLVESLEIMAACVHPAMFFDHAAKHEAVIRRLR
jgi:iron complex transport system substrate-binding protein